MRRLEIQVGKVYGMRLAGFVQPVRIQRDRGLERTTLRHMRHLGWDGIKLNSGNKFHVKAAKKVLCEMVQVNGKWFPREEAEGFFHELLSGRNSA